MVLELFRMTKPEIFSLAWFCLLRACGAGEGRGVSRGTQDPSAVNVIGQVNIIGQQ